MKKNKHQDQSTPSGRKYAEIIKNHQPHTKRLLDSVFFWLISGIFLLAAYSNFTESKNLFLKLSPYICFILGLGGIYWTYGDFTKGEYTFTQTAFHTRRILREKHTVCFYVLSLMYVIIFFGLIAFGGYLWLKKYE